MKEKCFRKPGVCDSIEAEETSSLALSTFSSMPLIEHEIQEVQVLQGIQGYRDTEIQGYRDTGIQGYRDTGIQG